MEPVTYEPLYSNFGTNLKFRFNPSGGFEIAHEPMEPTPDYFSLDQERSQQAAFRLYKKSRSLEAIIEYQKEIMLDYQRKAYEDVEREVEAVRSYYRKYFCARARNTQQELDCARREVLLAVFDGIIEGLNGFLFPKGNNVTRHRKSPESFGDMKKYEWNCIEDLIDPNRNRSLSEKKAVKAFLLELLAPDLKELARAVYIAKTSLERKYDPIDVFPQVCQDNAMKLINASKLNDEIKDTAKWYISTSPETDVGECIFEEDPQSDTTDLQRLQEEAWGFWGEAERLGTYKL